MFLLSAGGVSGGGVSVLGEGVFVRRTPDSEKVSGTHPTIMFSLIFFVHNRSKNSKFIES